VYRKLPVGQRQAHLPSPEQAGGFLGDEGEKKLSRSAEQVLGSILTQSFSDQPYLASAHSGGDTTDLFLPEWIIY
jgi:hypothetical protein